MACPEMSVPVKTDGAPISSIGGAARCLPSKPIGLVRSSFRSAVCLAALATMVLPAWSQQYAGDLANQSIEDLMNVEVSTVSKSDQKLSRTGSAVFVISPEDIQRSGATNIPDLLRMVPGVDVAQIDANTWAVSIRGFNSEVSNNLLVLLDGRAVSNTLSAGVFWDVLDLPLEDIERIEVIRGPGGSVWGANAVNGVINIITRKASDTHGGLATAGAGNLNQGFGTVQYGGALGKSTDYRVYTKYQNDNHMEGPDGQPGGDGWFLFRGGFRTDSRLSAKDTLTVEGDVYNGREGDPSTFLPSVTTSIQNDDLNADLSGGYLQTIWNHAYSERSDTTLQISYESYTRGDPLNEKRKTANVDFQHRFPWGERQNIVWGGNYRYSAYRTDGALSASLSPSGSATHVYGLFIQDEISLIPDHFYLTVGGKIEDNDYTGFGVWPSARATWQPTDRNMFWAAVSQAARTPAITDTSFRLNFAGFQPPEGPPVLIGLIGNPHFKNQGVIAYETGYRTTIVKRLSLDLAAFYNDYSNQQTTEPLPPYFEATPAPAHIFVPSTYENLMFGESHGVEIALNWKPMDRWTLTPGYAFEQIHMHTSALSRDTTTAPSLEGSTPANSAQLRSHLDLRKHLTWDASVFFIDRLTDPGVAAYTRLDTNVSWQLADGLAISLVGQNLLRDRQQEFETSGLTRSTLIGRSVFAKFAWRF
jgi:iron complex outermembrane recepter protein